MPQTGIKLTEQEKAQKKELVAKYGDPARIYYELKSYGFPHKSACAILGFIEVESKFDLNEEQKGLVKGAGLCRWTLLRKAKMMEIAAEHSSKNTWVSIDGQVYYLVYELETEDVELNKYLLTSKDEAGKKARKFCEYFARLSSILDISFYKDREEAAEKWVKKLQVVAKVTGSDREPKEGEGLGVSVERLYSSERQLYGEDGPLYITRDDSDKIRYQEIFERAKSSIRSLDASGYATSGSGAFLESKVEMNAPSDVVPKPTLHSGDVHGSKLPSAPSIVEAPYVEVKIGGVTIGVYQQDKQDDRYPNYVKGITVTKTNGSLNQYKVDLVHQIAPGNNPNYLDELISANGYNIITIIYGDANSGLAFREERALIISISQNFDFVNCNIQYTINATSSCIAASTYKTTYPAIENEKPSSIIRKLLYESDDSALLAAFPGMRDQSKVEQLNLIPNNDIEVSMGEVKDVSPLSYLLKLIAVMSSPTSIDGAQKSMYMMSIEEGASEVLSGAYFKITEVMAKQAVVNSPLLYEVDVGYRDENTVYDFSVSNDFAWAMAYKYGGTYPEYVYGIDDVGVVRSHNLNGVIKTDSNYDTADKSSAQNWWTQMTEFPVTANLTVKGLVQPMLLMSYIRINSVYFGNKRTTNGIYIVTGQTDVLSGNGFRTNLNLMKVAGDNQYVDVDARIIT